MSGDAGDDRLLLGVIGCVRLRACWFGPIHSSLTDRNPQQFGPQINCPMSGESISATGRGGRRAVEGVLSRIVGSGGRFFLHFAGVEDIFVR